MTAEEAKLKYAKLWDAYCNEWDSKKLGQLEIDMDELQPLIANRPTDLAWQEFADSLPGFNDYWASSKERFAANLREQRTP